MALGRLPEATSRKRGKWIEAPGPPIIHITWALSKTRMLLVLVLVLVLYYILLYYQFSGQKTRQKKSGQKAQKKILTGNPEKKFPPKIGLNRSKMKGNRRFGGSGGWLSILLNEF